MSDVEKKYFTLEHQGMSFVEAATASVTDGAFANYSMSASFVPLRTLDPAESSAGTIARVLATLLHDLNARK